MARHATVWALLLILVLPVLAEGETCTPDSQCGENEFCEFPASNCLSDDPVGQCVFFPPNGGCTHLWMPVCGCDLQTYSNGCEAQRAHASILYPDQCRLCDSSGGCTVGEVCRHASGTCDDFDGVCVGVPGECSGFCPQSCGCDGATYDNSCTLGLAGLSEIHGGPCDNPDDGLVTGVAFTDGTTLAWSQENGALGYDVYRAVESQAGQAPEWSCWIQSISATSSALPEVPPPGGLWLLQLAARFDAGPGTLGIDTNCVTRVPFESCP